MVTVNVEDIQPRYLYLDPAGGKKTQAIKSVRARSAIVVVGTDPMSRIFVLDTWADRVGTNEIVKNYCDLVERWKPQVAAFELAGQQHLLADPILDEAEKRGITIPITPVVPSNKVDKNFRIRAVLQPIIGAGRLILGDSQLELKKEILDFPMSTTVDLIDALASACSFVPPPIAPTKDWDEKRELARYLRESGVPPSEIERRFEEMGGYGPERHTPLWQQKLFHRMS